MEELDGDISLSPPIWAIFGDLMAGLVGVFVLLLVWFVCFQIELSQSLQEEVTKRQFEEQRRIALQAELTQSLQEEVAKRKPEKLTELAGDPASQDFRISGFHLSQMRHPGAGEGCDSERQLSGRPDVPRTQKTSLMQGS